MTPDEQTTLEQVHDAVQETRIEIQKTRTRVGIVDERTERIDRKTEKLDSRVFGPNGLEDQVVGNTEQISRLRGISMICAGTATTILAKLFNVLP